MSDAPGLVDPKEFEAQGELVRKASQRRDRADEALKKAEAECNAAHIAWMKAWCTFNRFAQEAAGLKYKAQPDADEKKLRYPGPPSTWPETSK